MYRSRWRSRSDLDHPSGAHLARLRRSEVLRNEPEALPWDLRDLDAEDAAS